MTVFAESEDGGISVGLDASALDALDFHNRRSVGNEDIESECCEGGWDNDHSEKVSPVGGESKDKGEQQHECQRPRSFSLADAFNGMLDGILEAVDHVGIRHSVG